MQLWLWDLRLVRNEIKCCRRSCISGPSKFPSAGSLPGAAIVVTLDCTYTVHAACVYMYAAYCGGRGYRYRTQCIVNAVSRGDFCIFNFLERYFGDTDSRILQISALIFTILLWGFYYWLRGRNWRNTNFLVELFLVIWCTFDQSVTRTI